MGQGYATQGVAWLLSYIKDKYRTSNLTAKLLTINTASVKILENAGFHAVKERNEKRDGKNFVVREYSKE